MVITVSVSFHAPAGTILELLRDLPEVPVLRHPRKGRSTVGPIDLNSVEDGVRNKGTCSEGFPEADPLCNFTIFVDDLTLLKVKGWVRVH